jgi:hypothetical protein
MTGDPKRLSAGGSESSDFERRLLQAGRSGVPRAARLLAIAARLGPAIGGAAGTGGAGLSGGTPKATGSMLGGLSGVSKGLAVLAAIAGVTGLVLIATPVTPSKVPRPPAAALPATPAAAKAEVLAPRAPADEPVPSVPTPAAAPAPVTSRSVRDRAQVAPPSSATGAPVAPTPGRSATSGAGGLSDEEALPGAVGTSIPQESEVDLLQRAQAALRADPSLALALTDTHAARFPRGTLSQEREVIAIEALVRSHRVAEARSRASEFFRAFPESGHRVRIQSLLAGATDSISSHNP